MLPFQIGRNRGAERNDHCRRVALLASRTSAFLPLERNTKRALTTAAKLHHYWSPFHDDPVLEIAADILDRLYLPGEGGNDETALAARTLEACGAFDEAMEFAALEGIPLAQAAESFHNETGPCFDALIADALRRVTSGTEYRPSPGHLPVLPKLASLLMRTSDESVSSADLARIAAGDPVLASRLIGAANSGVYGSSNTITRLNEAALRLGTPLARRVLIAACLGGLFASKPLQKLWEHSQEVASAAFELAETARIDGNTAWLAGLLHDIGRLVLLAAPAGPLVNLMELTEAGFPLVYAETLIWQTDHAVVGAGLLRNWEIPEEIVTAVEAHHQPERSDNPLASILFLAEERSAANSAPPGTKECLSPGLRAVASFRQTGLSRAALGEIGTSSRILTMAG